MLFSYPLLTYSFSYTLFNRPILCFQWSLVSPIFVKCGFLLIKSAWDLFRFLNLMLRSLSLILEDSWPYFYSYTALTLCSLLLFRFKLDKCYIFHMFSQCLLICPSYFFIFLPLCFFKFNLQLTKSFFHQSIFY